MPAITVVQSSKKRKDKVYTVNVISEGDPALIKTETVSLKAEPAERLEQETPAPEPPETEGKK